MVVKKKVSSDKDVGAAMIVGKTYDAEEDEKDNGEAEDELYNLMRGYETEEEEDETDSLGIRTGGSTSGTGHFSSRVGFEFKRTYLGKQLCGYFVSARMGLYFE